MGVVLRRGMLGGWDAEQGMMGKWYVYITESNAKERLVSGRVGEMQNTTKKRICYYKYIYCTWKSSMVSSAYTVLIQYTE